MSDTPETDAVEDMHEDLDVCLAEMTGLARKLERERDEARRALCCLAGCLEDAHYIEADRRLWEALEKAGNLKAIFNERHPGN